MITLKIFPNNKIFKLNIPYILLILILINFKAYAAYKYDPQYGNAQSSSFMNAMYGSNEGFTQEEIKAFNHGAYQSSNDKYFFRIGVSSGSDSLSKIKNISTVAPWSTAILVATKETINNQRNLEIALGYQANKFSAELELNLNRNLKYAKDPLFSGQPGTLNSVLKSQNILINGYYDILSFKNFKIFVGAGIGLNLHTVNSKFTAFPGIDDNIDHSNSSKLGSYNLLIGSKLKIISQCSFKFALRYTNLSGFSKFKSLSKNGLVWKDNDDNLILSGKRSFFGISFSIVHIFI